MTKTQKYIVYGGAIYLIGYLVWRKLQKPKSVLVSGSSENKPEDVKYATGKEMGADGITIYDTNSGSIDSLINIKKPIYIKPTNLIPSVYDRGIGQEVNCNGYMNAVGGSIQKNCNEVNMGKTYANAQLPLDLPQLT
jgi:hypothetical protein